jgi:hypothetical protein
MNTIKIGDKVNSISQPTLNYGLAMNATDKNENKILCQYYENNIDECLEKWFDEDDLIIKNEVEGVFWEL